MRQARQHTFLTSSLMAAIVQGLVVIFVLSLAATTPKEAV